MTNIDNRSRQPLENRPIGLFARVFTITFPSHTPRDRLDDPDPQRPKRRFFECDLCDRGGQEWVSWGQSHNSRHTYLWLIIFPTT